MRVITIGMTALAIGSLISPLAAQTAPPPRRTPAPAPLSDAEDDAGPDVVVEGNRLPPGSAVGDITPEQVLSPADIRSYGVSSLSDLLTELAPETRSDRGGGGAPVVLLNGRRISSFAEIRDIPTEAIARIDILPEEVALKYGYAADQRVVNVVLRRRFRAVTLEGADQLSTDGGRNTPTGHVDGLKIAGDNRINFDLNYTSSDPLFESDRNLAGRVASTPGTTTVDTVDQSHYRTLLSASQTFAANFVYSRPIGKVNATVNGRVQEDSTTGYQGLPGVSFAVPGSNPFAPSGQADMVSRYILAAPIAQRSSTLATHLGVGLNGNISAKWRWSFTGNYDRSHVETFTDNGFDNSALQARVTANDPSFNPYGPLTPTQLAVLPGNRADSTSNAVTGDVLLNGPLFKLPAGAVSTAIHVGAQATSFDTRSLRLVSGGTTLGAPVTGSLTRNIVNGQINVDVPLTGRRNKFLDAIGDLSLNGNLAVNQLSDFGTLWTIGYGANWSPVPSLRLIASFTDQDQAPSSQQLGNPVIITPNVRVFDYLKGITSDVTQTTGGNGALISSERHVFKLGATFKPSATKDITFTANYIKTGTDHPIANLPSDTPAIEAAFPGRFTRDGNGALTRIDARPVNFQREDTQELRYGINMSFPLKSKAQKAFEAFRAGKGPNPFTGLAGLFGRRPNGGQGDGQGRQNGDGQRGGDGGPPPGAAPPPPDGATPGGPPPASEGFGGGRPGGGFGGRGGGRGGGFANRLAGATGGRVQFAVYHTWHFVDRVTVANNVAPIDLLNGGATGAGGGQPRHEIEGQAGYSNNGLGFRLSANWQSATEVTGGAPGTPNTLHFGSLAKFDVRLFDDFTQNLDFLRKHHWAKGMRIGLAVTNIFNTRQRVTDQTGAVPLSYQGAYLDPLGRAVRLTVRKLIF